MLTNAEVVADADRRATSMRHIRAEAERDLARRRRLRERVRPLVAAERPSLADLAAIYRSGTAADLPLTA